MRDACIDPLAELVIVIIHSCHAKKAVTPGKIDVYVNLFFCFITIAVHAKSALYRPPFRLRLENNRLHKKRAPNGAQPTD